MSVIPRSEAQRSVYKRAQLVKQSLFLLPFSFTSIYKTGNPALVISKSQTKKNSLFLLDRSELL